MSMQISQKKNFCEIMNFMRKLGASFHCGKMRGYLFFLTILIFALINSFSLADINIVYQGLDKVHLTYFFTFTENDTQVQLVREDNYSKTVIKTGYTGSEFSGTILLPCSPYTYYKFMLIITNDPPDGPPQTRTESLVELTLGTEIKGALLFNETIGSGILHGGDSISIGQNGLTVPSGLSIEFNNVWIGLIGMAPGGTSYTYLSLVADGSVAFNRCKFTGSVYVYNSPQIFNNCYFRSFLNIYGGSPVFSKCELYSGAKLYGRTSAEFSGSIICTPILFSNDTSDCPEIPKWSEDGASPDISGNAFLGNIALYYDYADPAPIQPISIGPNYYGDSNPFPDKAVESNMFCNRAAKISQNVIDPLKPYFNVATPLKTSPVSSRKDKYFPPRFFLHNYLVGQNSLDHNPYSGNQLLLPKRETLVCCDISSTDDDVKGIEFYAMFNGKKISPTRQGMVLNRDLAKYSPEQIQNAQTTVNFILPKTDAGEYDFEVWLDPSKIQGYYVPGAKLSLVTTKIKFDNQFKRTLNIHILPIEILIPFLGYKWTGTNPTQIAEEILSNMPPKLPVKRTDLNVTIHRIPYIYPSIGLLGGWGIAANAICSTDGALLLLNLSIELQAWRAARRVFSSEPLDLLVGVLPQGAISGYLVGDAADGANTCLNRSVVFLDETKADAFHHEACHAYGLWTGMEQYVQYPCSGLPITGATAFYTDGKGAPPFSGGDKNRIKHFPSPGALGYNGSWTDIMGDGKKPEWTLPKTAYDFYTAILAYLAKSKSAEAREFRDVAIKENTKRIYLSAYTEKYLYDGPYGSSYQYKLSIGKSSVFVLNNISDAYLPAPGASMYPDVYEFAAMDKDMNILMQVEFSVPNDYASLPAAKKPDVGFFPATFDVPDTVVFYRIRRQASGEFIIRAQSESLGIDVLQPYPNQTLPTDFMVEWVDNQQGGLPKKAGDDVAPVQHNIQLSRDGGATWQTLMDSLASSYYKINTDLIPGGDNLMLRVYSSDGINISEKTISGLKIPNHPPKVWIKNPAGGDMGDTETTWTLESAAYDVEDGWIEGGTWTSSIDGVLGSGVFVEDLHLSPGNHEISYEVQDSAGVHAKETVLITVRNDKNMDLSINKKSLLVKSQKIEGHTSELPLFLTLGTSYSVSLNLKAMGVDTTHTLHLYIQEPGGIERLAAEQRFFSSYFNTTSISTLLVVNAKGEYKIRGVVDGIIPGDSDESNNQYTWTLDSLSGPDLGIYGTLVDFGKTGAANSVVQKSFKITNKGDGDLIVKNIYIEDESPNNFRITNAPAPDLIVKPLEEQSFTLEHLSVRGGTQIAKLVLETNDPYKPIIKVDLIGVCSDAKLIEARKISDYILGKTETDSGFDKNSDGKIDDADIIYLLNSVK